MWLDVPSFEDPSKEDSVFRAVVHIDPHVLVFVVYFYHPHVCLSFSFYLYFFNFRTVIHEDPHVNNIMFSSKDPNAEEIRSD